VIPSDEQCEACSRAELDAVNTGIAPVASLWILVPVVVRPDLFLPISRSMVCVLEALVGWDALFHFGVDHQCYAQLLSGLACWLALHG
jgi:hypothetical protein